VDHYSKYLHGVVFSLADTLFLHIVIQMIVVVSNLNRPSINKRIKIIRIRA
jgi:hypothetical protein